MPRTNCKGIESFTQSRGLSVLGSIALILSANNAQAGELNGQSATVGPDSAIEPWTLENGARLEVKPGGTTGRIDSFDSQVTIDGGSLVPGSIGIALTSSNLSMTNATIRPGADRALFMEYQSQATLTNSDIAGLTGLYLLPGNQATLSATRVHGIAQDGTTEPFNGTGAVLFSSTLNANKGSSLIGDRNGAFLSFHDEPTGAVPPSSLVVDHSSVQGINGSAILVEEMIPATTPTGTANILVSNGSTITGGNGTLLEVRGQNTANLTVDNSQLSGNVVASGQSTVNVTLQHSANLTGQLANVARLEVDSGATWHMPGDAYLPKVAMQGGNIDFGGGSGYRTLTLGSLSGSGTFAMRTDIAAGQGDLLDVQGDATGNHRLYIRNSGAEVDEASLRVVHTGGGAAQFGVVSGGVDLGTYQYQLVQRGNDWFLEASKTITPSTASVLGLFSAAPSVWYGELTSLRSRMGELRNGQGNGAWVRTYSNRFRFSASDNLSYDQDQTGLSLGADGQIPSSSGQWWLGVLAGTSSSDVGLKRDASGDIDSYYAGLYSTWLADNGYYLDAVLKANRLQNSAKGHMSDGTPIKGSYDDNGTGFSLEAGRHIKLQDGWFVEPFGQLAALWVDGKSVRLDNGLEAEGNHANSLLGKLGTSVGKRIALANGGFAEPYAKLAVAHEFTDDNRVKINGDQFTNDLSGTHGELGAGVAVQMSETLQTHLDLDYGKGQNVEQPYGVNLGLRYNF